MYCTLGTYIQCKYKYKLTTFNSVFWPYAICPFSDGYWNVLHTSKHSLKNNNACAYQNGVYTVCCICVYMYGSLCFSAHRDICMWMEVSMLCEYM